MRLALTSIWEFAYLINLEGNGGQFSITYRGRNKFADFSKGSFGLRGWYSAHKYLFGCPYDSASNFVCH
jgi:hypothetical protein